MVKKLIIDTDIGDDIDDAYALAFALNSPEFEIQAILTNNRYEEERAKIAHKLIKTTNKNIPVFEGVKGGKGGLTQKDFIKYSQFKPRKLEHNINFFKKLFQNNIYYISLGSLTNVQFLIETIPEVEEKMRFFIMGGTLKTNYHGKRRIIPEWNIASDVKSSQKVFRSKADITMIGLDCTWNLELSKNNIIKIRKSGIPLNIALNELYTYWKRYHKRNPVLHDPFTLAILIDKSLVEFQNYKISVDDRGRTVRDSNGKNIKIGVKSHKQRFLKLFMEKILHSK